MEEGEIFIFQCDECEGRGWITKGEKHPGYSMKYLSDCEKCEGKGWVDWARLPMNFTEA